jgi:hypothetical protein
MAQTLAGDWAVNNRTPRRVSTHADKRIVENEGMLLTPLWRKLVSCG